jgi:GTPase SAR1 family protein
VSGQAVGHFERALELAERFGLAPVRDRLLTLESRRQASRFGLAVVGEFGRGKTLLVNRILGGELVPTGVSVPVVVSVAGADHERVETAWDDGRTDTRSLDELDWQQLAEAGAAGAVRGIQIHTDRELVRRLDVEVLDTPGLQSGHEGALSLLRETLNGCDAVLMVVAATSPLSLSEAALLKEDIIGSHTPRITVVVSKLDLVEEAERASVLKDIRRRVERVSPEIAVMAGPGPSGDTPELDQLGAALRQLATSNERRQWREQQVAEQLRDRVREMVQVGEQGLQAAQLSAEERAAAAAQAREATAKRLLDWTMLRNQLEQRRLETINRATAAVWRERSGLLETMRRELGTAPDPSAWWEWEFPSRLAEERAALTERYEQQLEQDVRADLSWLEEQLRQRFDMDAGTWEPRLQTPEPRAADYEQVKLRDLTFLRRMASVVPGLARTLMNLLLQFGTEYARAGEATRVAAGLQGLQGSPASAQAADLASDAAEKLGQVAVERGVQSQRALVARQLEIRVTRAASDLSEQLSTGLRVLYGEVLDRLEASRQAWEESQSLALERSDGDDQPAWADLVDQATQLLQDIDHELADAPWFGIPLGTGQP